MQFKNPFRCLCANQNERVNCKGFYKYGRRRKTPLRKRIFENVKLLAPLLLFLLSVIVFCATIFSAILVLAGYDVNVLEIAFVVVLVIALEIYVLWPMISFEDKKS